MQLKCVAIDDEPLALELIRAYISKFPELKLLQTFEDAISGAEFLRQNAVDLLFIDIHMPDISGIDLVRSLQEKPIIIFTTAYKKFAFEGFELDALDYLVKPIDFERFSRAIHKAKEFYQYRNSKSTAENENIFVYSEYRQVKISLIDIEYIESLDDYIKIHFSNADPIMSLMTLKKIIEKLPPTQFKRIHRSYIISLKKVKSVLNRKVQLSSSTELPVSDTYADDFMLAWIHKR